MIVDDSPPVMVRAPFVIVQPHVSAPFLFRHNEIDADIRRDRISRGSIQRVLQKASDSYVGKRMRKFCAVSTKQPPVTVIDTPLTEEVISDPESVRTVSEAATEIPVSVCVIVTLS